jgi:transcription initiation factor TFIIB
MCSIDDLWAQYDSLRPQQEQKVQIDKYEDYFCECGGQKAFIPNDMPVCTQCGRVDFVYISEEAEWAGGIDNDGVVSDPSRCGGPSDTTFYSNDWHIGTRIVGQRKMAKIHFHMSMNHRDRALFHAYAEIYQIAKKLGCNDMVIDEAKILYKKFSESKLTRGDVRKGVKANCIFMACKTFGVPRTTKEIADACGLDTKDIGRTSTIVQENVGEQKTSVTMPHDVVMRILQNMSISDNVLKRRCIKMCEMIEKNPRLMGKTPTGIACAVIYHVIGDNISKNDICTSAGISIPTLNKIETTIRDLIKV